MIGGVKVTVILGLFFLSVNLTGELLKTGKLEKISKEVKVKRDIFRFGNSAPPPRVPTKEELEQERKQQEEIAAEEKQAEDTLQEAATVVIYEGFITDKNRIVALISIDGEYYFVSKKQKILDEVAVVEITDKVIILQVRDKKMEIEFKGGEEK